MTCTWNKDDVAKRSSITANEAYFMGATEIWSGGPNCIVHSLTDELLLTILKMETWDIW